LKKSGRNGDTTEGVETSYNSLPLASKSLENMSTILRSRNDLEKDPQFIKELGQFNA
jgi:hypothetical protein